MDNDRWRGIRYRTIQATGQLWSTPMNLAFLEAACHTFPTVAYVYDHTRYPQNLVTILAATPEAHSEKWPPQDNVSVPIERGLYVSYSHAPVGLTGAVTVGWLPGGQGGQGR